MVGQLTNKKSAMEATQKTIKFLEALISASIDGILLTDSNQNIIIVNQAFCDFFGKQKGEVIETNLSVWLDQFDGDVHHSWLKIEETVFNKGAILNVEFQKTMKNLKQQFLVNASLLKQEEKEESRNVLSIWREVSKLKSIEQELKNAFEKLILYKEFLTHDINNILHNIYSSTELCKIFFKDPKSFDKMKHQFDVISGQITRGVKLISNVRKLTQLTDISLQKKRIDLYIKLKKAINFVKQSFLDKNINVEINSFDKTLFADVDDLILEVFENLLINAVLHNINTNVNLIVRITKDQKDHKKFLKLEFLDNGIGITDDRKEWIFKDSFKKDNFGRNMGFGLTLVKKIIEIYGGFIWVENRVKDDYSQGSNFIILIPRGKKK